MGAGEGTGRWFLSPCVSLKALPPSLPPTHPPSHPPTLPPSHPPSLPPSASLPPSLEMPISKSIYVHIPPFLLLVCLFLKPGTWTRTARGPAPGRGCTRAAEDRARSSGAASEDRARSSGAASGGPDRSSGAASEDRARSSGAASAPCDERHTLPSPHLSGGPFGELRRHTCLPQKALR